MDSTPAYELDDVEAMIADLEVSFTKLRELEPTTMATTNNCTIHPACYTF